MTHERFDLIVIGSGPAGEKGAAQAAYFGKRVAIVEREAVLGGAAANTGTLPSKTLRETALTLSGIRARELYGIDISLAREATVSDFLRHKNRVVSVEQARIEANMARHRVTRFHGEASFVGPRSICVKRALGESVTIEGEIILIATGSLPRRPELFPFEDPKVYDSDEILQLHAMPKRMVVVGGGVIGCEYACTFAALGVEVVLIEGRETLLTFLDRELSLALKLAMEKLGIRCAMPETVTHCEVTSDEVRLTLGSGRSLVVDSLLVAAGRVSNTAQLNLEAAGIKTGPRGLIEVDNHFRTSVPHIYAAGDVIGFPALASTSMEQARLAMVHAFDLKYKQALAPILPYGIYTIPEVSMAGETEESCQAKGISYVVGKAFYKQNARGVIIGDHDGFLKLIFRAEDMQLVGVHVIGEIASELVHIGLMALMSQSRAELFIQSCFNYPTLGELYKYATYDAMGNRT